MFSCIIFPENEAAVLFFRKSAIGNRQPEEKCAEKAVTGEAGMFEIDV